MAGVCTLSLPAGTLFQPLGMTDNQPISGRPVGVQSVVSAYQSSRYKSVPSAFLRPESKRIQPKLPASQHPVWDDQWSEKQKFLVEFA